MPLTLVAVRGVRFLAATTKGLVDHGTNEAVTAAVLAQILAPVDFHQSRLSDTKIDDEEVGQAMRARNTRRFRSALKDVTIESRGCGRGMQPNDIRQGNDDVGSAAARTRLAEQRFAQRVIAIVSAAQGLEETRIGQSGIDATEVLMEVQERGGFGPNFGVVGQPVASARNEEGRRRSMKRRRELIDVLEDRRGGRE